MRFKEVERNIEKENLNYNNNNNDDFDFDKRIGEEGFVRTKSDTTYEESVDFWYGVFDKRI